VEPLLPGLRLRAVEVPSPAPEPPLASPSTPDDAEAEAHRLLHTLDVEEGQKDPDPPKPHHRAPAAARSKPRAVPSWALEERWFHLLLYPLRASAVVLVLAALWATLIVVAWAFFPLQAAPSVFAAGFVFLVIPFLLLGYTVRFLQETLAAARAGTAGSIACPALELKPILSSATLAVLAFLAGPIIPAALAVFFRLTLGEVHLIDRLILWELGLVSVGYWCFALFAGSKRDPSNDVATVEWIRWRAPFAATLMGASAVSLAVLTLATRDVLDPSPGWWTLFGALAMQLLVVVFLLRWFGVAEYRRRFDAPVAPVPATK
jgi:hypothetical protein